MTYRTRLLDLMADAAVGDDPDRVRLAAMDSLLAAEMLCVVEDVIDRPFSPHARAADLTVGDLIRFCDDQTSTP